MNIALVSPHFISEEYNRYTIFHSDLKDSYFKIKRHEFQNNLMFDGVIWVGDDKLLYTPDNIFGLERYDISNNELYCLDFVVGRNPQSCYINKNLFYSNSYVFSTLSNYQRTDTSLFGECFNHRIKLKKVFL